MTDRGRIKPSMGGSGSSTEIDWEINSESRLNCEAGVRLYDKTYLYEYSGESEPCHHSATVIRVFLNGHVEGIIMKVQLEILRRLFRKQGIK